MLSPSPKMGVLPSAWERLSSFLCRGLRAEASLGRTEKTD